jgi:hypothetical protein
MEKRGGNLALFLRSIISCLSSSVQGCRCVVDGCAIAQGESAFGDIGLIAALARRLGDAGVPAPATPLRVAR